MALAQGVHLPAMTHKGKAFVRPVCNKHHKQAVVADARSKAKADAARPGLETELYKRIAESGLDEGRAGDARAAVRQAIDKLEQNVNPLSGLSPPPSCVACAGSHRPHHFLCMKRKLSSSADVEKTLRNKLMQALRAAHSAQQHEAQMVSPPHAHAHAQLRALLLESFPRKM